MTGNIVILVCMFYIVCHSGIIYAEQYCIEDEFDAVCNEGEVIIIQNATYGRMKIGKCIFENYRMDCSVSVLQILDRLCSGNHQCSFNVFAELSQASPCKQGLTPYLEAINTCVKVDNLKDKACADTIHQLGHQSTFHLSTDAEDTQCGYTPPTWHLQVNPGQVIEVTLMDFTAPPERPTTCSPYGYIVETVVRSNRTICGSNVQRQTVLYTSVGPVLEITMLSQTMRLQQGIFALEYQVKGCEEPSLQHNVYYKRDGVNAVVGCSPDDSQWSIECMDGMWKGELGNCTTGDETGNSDSAFGSIITLFKDIPESVTIAIVIGIAVLLSLFVLVCGIVYIAKHRHTNDNISETYSHGPRKTDSEFKMYGPETSDTINKTPLMYQNTFGQHTPTKRNMYPTHGITVDKRDMYPVNKQDTDVCSCASYSSIPRLDKDQSEIVDDKQIYLDPVENNIQ